jgi:hypothetical protein
MIEQTIFYHELDLQDIHYGNLTITSLAMALMKLASEEQKQQYLSRILKGELEICLGYTEPGAGSDLAGITTRAVRVGDEYVINGQKVFTTGAHYASHIWLLARSEADAPRHKGLSVFIFPLATAGITVHPIYTMEGIRTNEVFLDDVHVPASAMIGTAGSGFHTAAIALDFERVFMGKYTKLRRNLDALMHECRQSLDGSAPPFDDPVVRDRLVGLHLDVERLRLLCLKSAWMIDQGQVPNAEASAQKVFASDLEQRLADEGIRIPRATRAARIRFRARAGARDTSHSPGCCRRCCASAVAPTKSSATSSPNAVSGCHAPEYTGSSHGTRTHPGTAPDPGRGATIPAVRMPHRRWCAHYANSACRCRAGSGHRSRDSAGPDCRSRNSTADRPQTGRRWQS